MVKVRCFASFVKGEEISQNDTFVCPMSTEMVGALPSLAKEGGPRSSRGLPTRSGWFVQPPRRSVRRLNKPLRPLHKGRFAPLLMSRPPLLCQGGEWPSRTSRNLIWTDVYLARRAAPIKQSSATLISCAFF